MGRSLDDKQQQELTAFVNAIATAAGYETSAEWARDSGYAYPNLTKLRAGRGAVDGFNLLRLLRAAASRSDLTTDQLALGLARATAPDAEAESVHARLDELTELVTEALELLRQAAEPEAPPQSEAQRQKPLAARL